MTIKLHFLFQFEWVNIDMAGNNNLIDFWFILFKIERFHKSQVIANGHRWMWISQKLWFGNLKQTLLSTSGKRKRLEWTQVLTPICSENIMYWELLDVRAQPPSYHQHIQLSFVFNEMRMIGRANNMFTCSFVVPHIYC